MQIPTFVETDASAAPDVDDAAAMESGFALAANAAGNPTAGMALLHGAAVLMAYLAFHEEDPEAAADDLLAEQRTNLHTCLHRMTAAPAGNA